MSLGSIILDILTAKEKIQNLRKYKNKTELQHKGILIRGSPMSQQTWEDSAESEPPE